MKYILLYNPLSRGGKTKSLALKYQKKLIKKGKEASVQSLLEITDVNEYMENLDPKCKVVILGGDGTIHHLANAIRDYNIQNNIYTMKKSGTGNDFVRSIKGKGKLIRINDYIKDLQTVTHNNENERVFVNSVGMGIDAQVCELLNESRRQKTDSNYFKTALKAFRIADRFELEITVDGETTKHEKVWFVLVTNGSHFGGGMRVSPKSKRLDDKLEVVVAKNLTRFFLLLIFPTIYLGIHKWFRKRIKMYQGKDIKLKASKGQFIQHDGETYLNVTDVEIHR